MTELHLSRARPREPGMTRSCLTQFIDSSSFLFPSFAPHLLLFCLVYLSSRGPIKRAYIYPWILVRYSYTGSGYRVEASASSVLARSLQLVSIQYRSDQLRYNNGRQEFKLFGRECGYTGNTVAVEPGNGPMGSLTCDARIPAAIIGFGAAVVATQWSEFCFDFIRQWSAIP